MWKNIVLVFVLCPAVFIKCQFSECYDDSYLNPDEGLLVESVFTWLGTLQYIHVKNGNPHYFRVPRVVLISRQFALCTAIDAAHVPEGYALGNVVFGDYERDEDECHITIEDIASGMECAPAVLLMPIADVLLHPEYKHFGAKNSVALLKLITPIKSRYMLPACLPFMNYLVDKNGNTTNLKLFHVDFANGVPRDFINEEKEVKRVSILPRELCYLYDDSARENKTTMTQNRMACTTGCGFHSGAPTLKHEHTGHWSVVVLSQGSLPCPDPLRPSRPSSPPLHIMIHTYVPWITTAIAGKPVGAYAVDDPFGITVARLTQNSSGWVGRWWTEGIDCAKRGPAAEAITMFYHEIFDVRAGKNTDVYYKLEIECDNEIRIACVKVFMPYRAGQPSASELNTERIVLDIPLDLKSSKRFKFVVQAWGVNETHLVEKYR